MATCIHSYMSKTLYADIMGFHHTETNHIQKHRNGNLHI